VIGGVAIALLAAVVSSCAAQTAVPPPSATPAVIPLPESIEISGDRRFVLTPQTVIVVPRDDERVAAIGRFLSDWIGIAAAPQPPRVQAAGPSIPPASIVLTLGSSPVVPTGAAGPVSPVSDDAYELSIAPERVTIRASQPAGLFYGVQTFRQLLPPFVEYDGVRPDESRQVWAPAAHVVDRPRFSWRGAMLDVARHFFTTDDVKRYIDLIALYKMNRLHLHLADDQGWRIEIKSWPNLTRHGGSTEVGGGPGGFYTQADYADLVAYAASRFVTIVPEIDMPGHTNAALASYAELNCNGRAPGLYTGIDVGFSALCVDSDVTYRFIDDVVREIAALTPGAYFHIGGDEVKTLTAQQYSAFVTRVQGIVDSHGKRMIGWDEIAGAALRPASIVQHWRPDASPAAAAAQGTKVIASPANRTYLDMKYDKETVIGQNWAAYIEARDAYDWDPATLFEGVPESSILGVEAPLWSETTANLRDVEFLAFPRLAEIAEIGWSSATRRRWDELKVRLASHGPRWTALGINFYRSSQVPW
jgi:hexosaminidase